MVGRGPVARVVGVVICPGRFFTGRGRLCVWRVRARGIGFALRGRRAARPRSGRRSGRRCCSRSGGAGIGRDERCSRRRARCVPGLCAASRRCPPERHPADVAEAAGRLLSSLRGRLLLRGRGRRAIVALCLRLGGRAPWRCGRRRPWPAGGAFRCGLVSPVWRGFGAPLATRSRPPARTPSSFECSGPRVAWAACRRVRRRPHASPPGILGAPSPRWHAVQIPRR